MVSERRVSVGTVDLPHFALPRVQPQISPTTYSARIARTFEAMQDQGFDALIIYGDREHFANTTYLTGFDPRWEESLLVLIPGSTPYLIVGNEDVAYANVTPYPVTVRRFSKFSLIGQPDPDDLALVDLFNEAGLSGRSIRRIGLVGWKYFEGAGADGWIELPHFIVRLAETFAESVENANGIFVRPGSGLRLVNEVDQIAQFEFAGSHASAAMGRLIHGVRPGMTELEASSLMCPILLPFSYHPTMLSGDVHTRYGIASAGSRELAIGDPVSAGIGYWGSNTARAGFLVENATQLPDGAEDYLERLVTPLFDTAAAWYETIRIGLTAGELYDVTSSRLGHPFFGLFLNPGHYVHVDEWPSSSVVRGSRVILQSGNALQLDILPMPVHPLHTSQVEDAIVLADETLRQALQARYPDAWERIQQRRDVLSRIFGIDIHADVLPLSNMAGYLPPFWLAPDRAMVRR